MGPERVHVHDPARGLVCRYPGTGLYDQRDATLVRGSRPHQLDGKRRDSDRPLASSGLVARWRTPQVARVRPPGYLFRLSWDGPGTWPAAPRFQKWPPPTEGVDRWNADAVALCLQFVPQRGIQCGASQR